MYQRRQQETHYSVLGVDQTASFKEIRKAYLKASLKYHPDKNPNADPEEARAQFIKIGEAYEVLSDSTKRAAYDDELVHNFFNNQNKNNNTSQNYSNHDYSKNNENAKYENYREAFDATFSNLSEKELRDVMGAAAMIGSVVGGILGARMLRRNTKNNNNARSAGGGMGSAFLESAGSMVGSMVASEAASAFVKTAHEQSRERALKDHERRERVARGEPVPPVAAGGDSVLKDLLKKTAETIKDKAFEKIAAAVAGGSKSSTTSSTRQ